jgi:uncharacterized protein YbaR (Trm112 family)
MPIQRIMKARYLPVPKGGIPDHWFLLHTPFINYHHAMDTRLLELLVCPVTKGPLEYQREIQELISRSARLAYPVRDGIPILLENEARTLTDEELGL